MWIFYIHTFFFLAIEIFYYCIIDIFLYFYFRYFSKATLKFYLKVQSRFNILISSVKIILVKNILWYLALFTILLKLNFWNRFKYFVIYRFCWVFYIKSLPVFTIHKILKRLPSILFILFYHQLPTLRYKYNRGHRLCYSKITDTL